MFDLNKIVRKNILEMKPYSSARDEFSGSEGVFLDANENPYGHLNRYPDPYQNELKNAIAKQAGIKTNRIFVGNGSDEVIDLIFRIFCEPGKDKSLTFSPSYGMYDVSASINNIRMIKLPLTNDFQIDLAQSMEALKDSKIKVTLICSPNNPTGNAFPKEVVEQILRSSQSIVVIDEAYIDFSDTGSFIGLIDNYPNLIITRSMSKAWGLAAARIGYAFSNEAIIQLLNKVKPPYNVSLLNQKEAIKSLKDPNRFKTNIQYILEEKQQLIEKLNSMALVKKIYPSDANFLLVQFTDADRIYEELIDRQIIVRNRNSVVRNCIRITVGTREENRLLLNALKRIEDEKSLVY